MAVAQYDGDIPVVGCTQGADQRVGVALACQQEQTAPDLMCLGKGLTGGYLPMAATLARPHVYDAFLGPVEASRQDMEAVFGIDELHSDAHLVAAPKY